MVTEYRTNTQISDLIYNKFLKKQNLIFKISYLNLLIYLKLVFVNACVAKNEIIDDN